MTHNGWSNFETWCVNLWLSNDEGLYHATQDTVRDARDRAAMPDYMEGITTAEQWAAGEAADAIEEMVRELVPAYEDAPGLVSDLLGAALSDVDWREIAEHWIADLAEED